MAVDYLYICDLESRRQAGTEWTVKQRTDTKELTCNCPAWRFSTRKKKTFAEVPAAGAIAHIGKVERSCRHTLWVAAHPEVIAEAQTQADAKASIVNGMAAIAAKKVLPPVNGKAHKAPKPSPYSAFSTPVSVMPAPVVAAASTDPVRRKLEDLLMSYALQLFPHQIDRLTEALRPYLLGQLSITEDTAPIGLVAAASGSAAPVKRRILFD